MANFALIQGTAVTELFDTDPQLSPDLDVRDVSGIAGLEVGWTVDAAGHYHPPTGYTWDQARGAASVELQQTMNIVVRCLERQDPVPNDWIIYRDTLRQIRDSATGDPTVPFPPRPSYPPGIDIPPGYPPGEVVWPPPETPPVTFILPSGAPSSQSNLPVPQAQDESPKVRASAPKSMKFGMA